MNTITADRCGLGVALIPYTNLGENRFLSNTGVCHQRSNFFKFLKEYGGCADMCQSTFNITTIGLKFKNVIGSKKTSNEKKKNFLWHQVVCFRHGHFSLFYLRASAHMRHRVLSPPSHALALAYSINEQVINLHTI